MVEYILRGIDMGSVFVHCWAQVDLVGGYYDAGDHVKFGLPMAFSVTLLSWAAVEFRKEITELNQLANTLWAIRWGTDYFMKAHSQPNVLWGQVRLMLKNGEFDWFPISHAISPLWMHHTS